MAGSGTKTKRRCVVKSSMGPGPCKISCPEQHGSGAHATGSPVIPKSMNAAHTEWSWSTADGSQIVARHWKVSDPVATVLITHGLGDHSGRFENVARVFNERGFSVLIPDLRGHGNSEGQRGFVRRFDDFLNDMDRSIFEIQKNSPSLPVFAYGQSFGGLLVLYHALRRNPPLKGIVSSSPAIRIAMQAPAWKVLLGLTVQFVYPRLSLRTALDLGELSDDPDHESCARADELLHGRITPRTYFGMIDAGNYCLKHAADLTTPTLIMHGGLDTITDPGATWEFTQSAPGVIFKEWPNGKHELHQMANGTVVVGFAAHWMSEQLNNSSHQPASPG